MAALRIFRFLSVSSCVARVEIVEHCREHLSLAYRNVTL
jgi:hypothetical protein